jgi:NTE family protein
MDALDQDAFTLERINKLVDELPRSMQHGMRPIELLQLRPSVDLGRLASAREPSLPGGLRYLTSGLGTEETLSPDWLSVLLFEEEYVARLLEIGYEDGRKQHDAIEQFFEGVSFGDAKRSQSTP